MSSRIDEIQQIIALVPDDPFPRYGLALAYKEAGQLEDARRTFEELQTRHPTYEPQYLMHGNLLAQLLRPQEARAIYEAGLRVVKSGHTRGELQGALDRLSGGDPEDE